MTIRNPHLVMKERSRAAVDLLEKQAIFMPTNPGGDMPRLVNEVTSLPDDDLMELYVEFTSWLDYAAAQSATAAIDERSAQRVVDRTEAASLVSNWGGSSGDRVALSKARAATSPEVVAAYELLDERHAFRKMAEVITTNLDRDASLLSREITRRTAGPKKSGTRFS